MEKNFHTEHKKTFTKKSIEICYILLIKYTFIKSINPLFKRKYIVNNPKGINIPPKRIKG